MAIPLVVNGVTYQYPQQFDKNWGPTLTNWSQAVTNGMLQKSGGSFPLTAEVDFGVSFGLKVLSIKSQESNIATTGYLRLGNASPGIAWRNAANSANLALTVNASNQLTFNGTSIGATTSLTNGHILVGNVSNQPADVAMSGDATISNAGLLTIANSAITDAKVSASAAIALSKLATPGTNYWYVTDNAGVLTPIRQGASRAVVTDANGLPTTQNTLATEIDFVHGVTSAIQTQLNNRLQLAGGTMSGVLNMGSNKIQALTQGSSAGEAICYPVGTSQISAGAITTALLAANAVSQAVNSATSVSTSSTLVTTQAITTSGGKVLVAAFASGSASSSTVLSKAQATVGASVSRGGTTIIGARANLAMNNTANTFSMISPVFMVVVDSPAAGTYTYSLFVDGGASDYSLALVELKA